MVKPSKKISKKELNISQNASTSCKEETKVRSIGDRKETVSLGAGPNLSLDPQSKFHTLISVLKI